MGKTWLVLDGVLQNAARSIGEQLKYTRLDGTHSGPTNRKAFDLLCKARVLHRIPACDPSGLPLGATRRSRRPKSRVKEHAPDILTPKEVR